MERMLRPLARFVRDVGFGIHAGNAIRHGRPLGPTTRDATARPPAAARVSPPAPRNRRLLGG
ncbi:hypothetical protein [Streptomyces hainanensis]|uniref:Uncharacterized protein n=1 Tax=Streptomyces hainanensis TaxID=402648 RepID=A0A4R4TR21_9ACTN|nr:hypothetical protein [Streptomyces hainanensis]TDC80440.1 hypothetical protein E1283_00450 [Streptomyces hainanensis]